MTVKAPDYPTIPYEELDKDKTERTSCCSKLDAHRRAIFGNSAIFNHTVLIKSIFCGLLATLYKYITEYWTTWQADEVNDEFFKVLGISVGFLLVFKTQLSYGRFWEARGHVGSIIQSCRSLGQQLMLISQTSDVAFPAVGDWHRWFNCFFGLLIVELRREEVQWDWFKALLTEEEIADIDPLKRRALVVMAWIRAAVLRLHRGGAIGELMFVHLSEQMDAMLQSYHGAVKIATTPIPYPYEQLVWIVTTAYCLSVPVILVPSFGWWSFIPSFVISVVFFGLNEVSNELVDPYGHDASDLPLTGFGQQLRQDLQMYEQSIAMYKSAGTKKSQSSQ